MTKQADKAKGNKELENEIERLKHLLEEERYQHQEAKETLEAIRTGAVDGIVRSSPEGEQVFILKGSDQPYRNLIEEMSEGALLISETGTILYANIGFAGLVDAPLDKVIGTHVSNWVSARNVEVLNDIISGNRKNSRRIFEIAFQTIKQKLIPTQVSISKIVLNSINVSALIITDLTKHMDEEIKHYTQELENAQIALFESEQRWATTLTSIGDAVIATDTLGKIRFMNGVAEKLTGWTLNEASKRPVQGIFKIADEVSRKPVYDPVSKVLQNGSNVGLENHTILIRKDKTEIAIDDSGSPIKNKEGKTVGVVFIFRDISERRKVEKLLECQQILVQQEKDRLSSLLNSITDEVWFADTEKKFTLANPSAVAEFKLDLSGLKVDVENLAATSEVCRPDGSPRPIEEAPPLRALRGEIVKNQEEIIRTPRKGELRFRQVSASPVRDVKGVIIGSVSVVRDITEQKKAQDSLVEAKEKNQRERERLEVILGTVPAAVVIVEAPDGRITYANNRAFELYGFDTTGLSLEVNLALVTPKRIDGSPYPTEELPATRALKHGQLVHNEELIIKRADGSEIYIIASASPVFDDKNRIVSAIVAFEDITQRIKAENKLREYQVNLERLVEERTKQLKDSERLAAIGATAGMVGHDIRNPLQAITGDVYLAKSDLTSMPECEGKQGVLESLIEVEKNIEYINKIVQDLQDFAKPLKPNAEETDLKGIIDDLLLKNDWPKNVEVSIKIETQKIVADSTFINRIMYNLVNNAVQAMPDGGKLTIHTYKQSNDTVIAVKDTGVGIPEAVKRKLFTPMFTTKSKGQGFGLAVIKRMAEALGGTVSFESQEGKGTTFTVRLPPPKK
jgi:PAS domain S-box-containing protein